jgi:hypothetical protein
LADVVLRGAPADHQALCDLRVREPLAEEIEYLLLALG